MSATAGTDTTVDVDPAGGARQRPKPSELLERYNGDAMRMAERLADVTDDNAKYRERVQTLQAQVKQLTERQVPDNARVLTGDEVSAYEAYQALGKPDELKQQLDEGATARTEVASLRRDATLREVAQVAGYKLSVLKQLLPDREFQIDDVTEDGKTVKRALVKDGEQFRPLTEVVEQDQVLADFLPALKADAGQEPGARWATTAGVAYPPQTPSAGQAAVTAPVDSYISNTYRRPGQKKE